MTRILAINGSYRENGTMDQALTIAREAANTAGAEIEVIHLRDHPVEFCHNCRACTQQPGSAPGRCVLNDDMHQLIEKIEAADAYILASPTNFYTVTAIYKRFLERLVGYAWWPWDMPAPRLRKQQATKKALLIASCAAPGLMGRLFYNTMKQLKQTARTIGAKPVGNVFIGLVSQQEQPVLDARTQAHIRTLVSRLN